MSITGKRRYRVGGLFRSKLILQVQFEDHYMLGQSFERCFRWRDARVEDLMTIEARHQPLKVAQNG